MSIEADMDNLCPSIGLLILIASKIAVNSLFFLQLIAKRFVAGVTYSILLGQVFGAVGRLKRRRIQAPSVDSDLWVCGDLSTIDSALSERSENLFTPGVGSLARGRCHGSEGMCVVNTYVDSIGEAAGDVWRAFGNEHAVLTTLQLKRRTRLPDHLLYAALGWLAREGKVQISRMGTKTEVLLT